jgi:hypothetical protein
VVLFREKEQQMLGELKVKLTALIREVEAKISLISGHYELRLKEFARWFEEKAAGVKEWAVRELNLATGLHSELKRKYD